MVLWKNNKTDKTLVRLTKTEKDKRPKWIKSEINEKGEIPTDKTEIQS